ncbi:MAG: prepilin-type N-terminal cleavage/methylation domain-containing protein [Planctomycetota bacterium]|nr:MAG: prepilin-type N-terminal cleavage/methylation domain-containing protein [Planctomycetota bacterium]
MNPDGFAYVVWKVLGTWPSLSASVWIGLALSAFELALAMYLLVARQTTRALIASGIVLIVFCIVLVRLMLMEDPPSCGCLSAPGLQGSKVEHAAGLGRNIALVWMITIVMRRHREHPQQLKTRSWPKPTGFTIVELLVVVAVLVVLVSLVLPSLGKSHLNSKAMRQAVTQRQTFMALTSYVEDHGNTFPFFGTRANPYGPVTINGEIFDGGYFNIQSSFWASALVPRYIPDRTMIEHEQTTQHLLETGRSHLVLAQSALSDTVFAAPAFFTWEARKVPLDFSHFRATRLHEVVYPSHKILLTSWWGTIAGDRDGIGVGVGYPATFADGSTEIFSKAQILLMPSVDCPFIGDIPIRTTEGGLAGRDR